MVCAPFMSCPSRVPDALGMTPPPGMARPPKPVFASFWPVRPAPESLPRPSTAGPGPSPWRPSSAPQTPLARGLVGASARPPGAPWFLSLRCEASLRAPPLHRMPHPHRHSWRDSVALMGASLCPPPPREVVRRTRGLPPRARDARLIQIIADTQIIAGPKFTSPQIIADTYIIADTQLLQTRKLLLTPSTVDPSTLR